MPLREDEKKFRLIDILLAVLHCLIWPLRKIGLILGHLASALFKSPAPNRDEDCPKSNQEGESKEKESVATAEVNMEESSPTPVINNKALVGLSYNNQVGGYNSLHILSILDASSITEKFNIDYRTLVPAINGHIFFWKLNLRTLQHIKTMVRDACSQIDELIIPGATKHVNPYLYNDDANNTGDPALARKTIEIMERLNDNSSDLSRNMAELAMAHLAFSRGIPMQGICNGLQIINSLLGGTLRKVERNDLGLNYGNYNFAITKNTDLGKLLEKNTVMSGECNTSARFTASHEYGVDELGGSSMIWPNTPKKPRTFKENQDSFAQNEDKMHWLQPVDPCDYFRVSARYHASALIAATEQQYGAPIRLLQFHPEATTIESDNYTSNLEGDVRDMFARAKKIADDSKAVLGSFDTAAQTHQRKRAMHKELILKHGGDNQAIKNSNDPPVLSDVVIEQCIKEVENRPTGMPLWLAVFNAIPTSLSSMQCMPAGCSTQQNPALGS